ncbi:SLATT domain-containing protein [Echinicola sp. 20G]|uniref:SLATT domain-containing protein n=1 Tax=Echinicola sp. 20G TaxID=2781961 RepID=UPI0019104F1C|nr:SLATT domain-containing protein [Echinicola sp. 20G]
MKASDRNWGIAGFNNAIIIDYLNKIIEYSDEQLIFYTKGKSRRRYFSNAFILLAVLGFSFSLILPILKGPSDEICIFNQIVNYYSIGYLSLALASVALLLDRLFGHSMAWMRFTSVKMQLDKIIAEFNGKWIQLLQSIDVQNPTLEQKNELMTILLAFDTTIRETIITETESWKTLFSEQLQSFNSKVNEELNLSREQLKTNKEEIKKNIKQKNDEENKKNQRGALLIEFEKEQKAKVTISLKGASLTKTLALDESNYSCSFDNLKLGRYLLTMTTLDTDKTKTIEKFVSIKEDEIVEIKHDFRNKKEN